MPPPPGWMSWDRLLSPPVPSSPSPLPDTDTLELRSLAFYQQIVAPTLCGPLDSSFWTRLVSQMTHSEPATRHAVLAISSLYEHFDDGDVYCLPRRSNDFAIQHYNAAIQLLISPHTSKKSPADLNTVLLVCILFTCIEFLRGDPESAISHSQHGISLLNSGKDIKPELVRVFRHLSIFPYFFGGQISTFPVLNDAQVLGGDFVTAEEALESLDWLLSRAVRLVRASDYHRLGVGKEAQPLEAILLEQTQLEADLDLWWLTFSRLRRQSIEVQDTMTLLILEMRWLVCSIWADTCLSPHEMIYDGHVDKFQRIIAMATHAQSVLEHYHASSIHHKFMFIMGFCPLLYFVVTKCRFFKLRLRALSLLRTLSYMRETLWDASTLYAIGKRIVELEHGIHMLTPDEVDGGGCHLEGMCLPRDELRVRDSAMEADLDVREIHGRLEVRRRICFLVWGPEGIERLYDWLF
ncbi:C6 zinc finger domain protein [Moelleriella libera RCEF 2490]|uniref:C6 zinc finger domain protein n=1 Tax=Moelleriella libera RCEF 2490 TaxID=1081109 RepID=A0A167YC52_9HYPO|nr:C6 zinc finger domain protein [Moelleriella libera RCEF 2490]